MEMKKVLYLSNIEVPYRVRFFNELARYCNLTVLYERRVSSNRDIIWSKSHKNHYSYDFLDGLMIGSENAFSLKFLKHIFGQYDFIIVGCYNSPVQMLAIMTMRLFRIPYIINTDGEVFLNRTFKTIIKKYFLQGAACYLTAGEKAEESLKIIANGSTVIPYYFSSLSQMELNDHSKACAVREKYVLVVGQYFPYKGMDVALEAAKIDPSIHYKFVGMGKRTQQFIEEQGASGLENVEIIPFLQKQDLTEEYRRCAALVLPSRQECWGLVVNEAASFGTPIVSTWGSGAAVEFLAEDYPQYLAKPGDAQSLYQCIKLLRQSETKDYSEFLKEKSRQYSIEKSVQMHLRAFDTKSY